jgi:hypothetical protein
MKKGRKMTKWLAATALGLALTLAGCEDGAPEQNLTTVKTANPHSDQLKKMSPLYRNLGLRRAILDSGQRCKNVIEAAYQEDYKNMAMWTARCSDTGDFAIFIAANANVQVRQCKDAGTLGLPRCRALPAKG